MRYAGLLLCFAPFLNAASAMPAGALINRDSGAECPLRRTEVQAEITGFLGRVTLTQVFENTARDSIEAVYVFPLPHEAAVDGMTLQVGTRVIKGVVKTREEARALYDAARSGGRRAALLDQERPNIFTQHIANILPGDTVRVQITWVERISYEGGVYEWVLPMVVGPRYKAASTVDPGRISPPVARPETRAGHDISITVRLDAGMPLDYVGSSTHDVVVDRPSATRASVRLRNQATIPNKDFVLRYDAAGGTIRDAVLTHSDARGGYFTLILQPPERIAVRDLTPKEIVFVLDTSGSMRGFPIEKAKEAMTLAIAQMNSHDTFNVITFSGDTHVLFPQPSPATASNVAAAKRFLASRQGSGGTEMMKAIRAALQPSDSQRHVRVVCFMTDGYVGNEDEILAAIRTYPEARIFSFGIGEAVNRYLLDRMALEGRGEVEYVSLHDDGSAAAKRFHERVRNPLLTDISIDWNGLPVADALPRRIPDLFSAKPLVVAGRYTGSAKGRVRITGKLAGAPWSREIDVHLPESAPDKQAIGSLWARLKVNVLSSEPNSHEEITRLGLDYRLMTPFTSFVAVEETVVRDGGAPRRVEVPVEIPEGVSYEGIFGESPANGQEAAMHGVRSVVATPAFLSPSPQQLRLERPRIKLAPQLRGRSGVVRIQLTLRSTDEATVARLKALGFVETARPKGGRTLIGRIDASKLAALAAVDAVTWIAPAP